MHNELYAFLNSLPDEELLCVGSEAGIAVPPTFSSQTERSNYEKAVVEQWHSNARERDRRDNSVGKFDLTPYSTFLASLSDDELRALASDEGIDPFSSSRKDLEETILLRWERNARRRSRSARSTEVDDGGDDDERGDRVARMLAFFLQLLEALGNSDKDGQADEAVLQEKTRIFLQPTVGEQPICVICQEELRPGERGRLLCSCGHVFHLACIDRWLADHRTCPLCKTKLE